MSQSPFLQKILALLQEMKNYKVDPTKNGNWKPEYDDLYESIEEIYTVAKECESIAEDMFVENTLSQYNNFSTYVYNTSGSSKSLKHNEITKTKSKRTNHKKMRCPKCSKEVPAGKSASEYICSCGYIGEINIKGPSLHSVADSSKHVIKLLDKILGISKPTKHILKILNIMIEWLTNRKHLYNWLIYKNTLPKWMEKYNKAIEPDFIETTKFFSERIIERTEENIISPDEFKVFTDELYDMLNYFKKLHDSSGNNMLVLDDVLILNIIIDYMNDHGNEIPPLHYIHEYKDEKYELGHYFTYLSLIVDNDKYPLKYQIEDIFEKSLTQPGLMFDFNEIKGDTSIKFPSKFQYLQEYPWFIRMIFNTTPPVVSDKDKKYMTDLILAFNSFYKNENKTEKNKECNAPLFVCVLENIIKLPYFRKYEKDIIKLLPKKQNHTSSNISFQWIRFNVKHKELVRPFRSYNPEEYITTLQPVTKTNTSAITTDNEDMKDDFEDYDDENAEEESNNDSGCEGETLPLIVQKAKINLEFKDDEVF